MNQIAANDNYIRESRKPIACPTLSRLVKDNNKKAVSALVFWRDLTKPGNPFDPEDCGHCLQAVVPNESPQPEREMRQLFSKREFEYIEAAANDNNGKPTFDGEGQAHLGGLTFRDGKCVTPGVFNDDDDFSEMRQTSTPNGASLFGEEKYSSAFEAEIMRSAEERYYRERLGDGAYILDLAVSDSTAEEIGRQGDESQVTAIKRGKRLILGELEQLMKINEENLQEAA